MKTVLLTTETAHHTWFAREVAGASGLDLIVAETRGPAPPFATAHPYEQQRDAYEREVFFAGGDVRLADIAPVITSALVNDAAVIDALRDLGPDTIIVFGTGRVGLPLMGLCPGRIVNLHGGDPEHYRGLDTHLWAIYHRDFGQLITTLHHLSPEIDTGDIILQAPVRLSRGMRLCQLRARNTEICLELTLDALAGLRRTGRFPARPQRQAGRYYSSMPTVLKQICVERFARHMARVDGESGPGIASSASMTSQPVSFVEGVA